MEPKDQNVSIYDATKIPQIDLVDWPDDQWPMHVRLTKRNETSKTRKTEIYTKNRPAYINQVYFGDGLGSSTCSVCHIYVGQQDNYCRLCGAHFIGVRLLNRIAGLDDRID